MVKLSMFSFSAIHVNVMTRVIWRRYSNHTEVSPTTGSVTCRSLCVPGTGGFLMVNGRNVEEVNSRK